MLRRSRLNTPTPARDVPAGSLAVPPPSRRLRALLAIAVVWGGIWFLAGCVFYWALRLTGLVTENTSFVNMIGVALRIGIAGAVASTVFSLLIGVLYQGRTIREINWIRFALGGGLISAVFILGMMFVPRLLAGEPLLLPSDWLMDAVIAGGFGLVAAGGTMKVAQM
ncbi:MAG: hypothetical protein ACO3DS_09920, partial [Phycisphaerales bacterium]